MIRTVLWTVTLARFVLLPAFLIAACGAQGAARAGVDASAHRAWAVGILLVIGISDILDGLLARRYRLASQAGAVVDAVADKLVQVAALSFFAFSRGPAFPPLPVWYLVVVVARDATIALGWLTLRLRRVRVRYMHLVLGRLSWASVFVVLSWVTLGMPPRGVLPLTLLSSVLIAASTGAYVREGLAQLGRAGETARF